MGAENNPPSPDGGSAGPPLIPPAGGQSEPVEPIPRKPPWGPWATLGLVAVIMLASILAQVLMVFLWALGNQLAGRTPSPHEATSNGLLLSMATCVSAPVIVGLSWLFARIRAGQHAAAAYLGFRRVPRKVLFRWTIPLLLFIAFSDSLTALLGRPVVPPFMVKAYETAGFMPLLWLSLIVAAPVGEETLFRGFLFEGISHSRLGAAGAVFLGSVLWASIHVQYDAYGIGIIFVCGLFLGYIRLKTQSIYPTIFLHGLMNLIALVEVMILPKVAHSGDVATVVR